MPSRIETEQRLRDMILGLIAEQQDLPPGSVDSSQNFIDLGISSSDAVFLCGVIEEHLGAPVDPVLVFEADSLDDFVTNVLQSTAVVRKHLS